ncbi:hypothetical protein J6590_004485 [Homalodisca vitripennis]|nr:hypothetical protein J6590_004485 [Homalodisca vitripennis]
MADDEETEVRDTHREYLGTILLKCVLFTVILLVMLLWFRTELEFVVSVVLICVAAGSDIVHMDEFTGNTDLGIYTSTSNTSGQVGQDFNKLLALGGGVASRDGV